VWSDGAVSTTDPDAVAARYAELERLAVELAEGAARIVREHRSGGLSVSAKSTDTDLVTEVDRATERWLVEQLAERRPDDAILGEEGGGRPGTSGVRWLLDPIDGTVNFVLGIPQYAVSVAAEVDGAVVAGAVCNPISCEVYHARFGGGAYLGEARLSGPRDVPLHRAVVGTGFGYDPGVRTEQIAVVAPLLPRIADIRRIGAASLDLCFLAAGRLDAYFEAGLNPWDHAAGGLVATEAGCVASGLHGRPPGKPMYAAAGPGLAAVFFAALEELGADRVSS
jgi:myo-inositol-1(or 4)-monophosphatase